MTIASVRPFFAKAIAVTHDEQARQEQVKDFALDWYTGAAHGAIRTYPDGEPRYEAVRADVMRWLRSQR